MLRVKRGTDYSGRMVNIAHFIEYKHFGLVQPAGTICSLAP
jgi:hypothetical protein